MKCHICEKEKDDIRLQWGPIGICKECGGRKMWTRFRRVKESLARAVQAVQTMQDDIANLAAAIASKKEQYETGGERYVPCISKYDYTCIIETKVGTAEEFWEECKSEK